MCVYTHKNMLTCEYISNYLFVRYKEWTFIFALMNFFFTLCNIYFLNLVFDDEEESKLTYTEIHQEYRKLVSILFY